MINLELSGKVFLSLLGVLLLISVFDLLAQEDSGSPILEQEQIKQVSKLLLKHKLASEEDARLSRNFLAKAKNFASHDKWGAAFKAYGESAVIDPSVEALEGMAISVSKISRERKNCIETIGAKTRDFSEALAYFATALEFSNATEGKNSLRYTYAQLVSEQQSLVDPLDECLR
jgi:hypothetical protein